MMTGCFYLEGGGMVVKKNFVKKGDILSISGTTNKEL